MHDTLLGPLLISCLCLRGALQRTDHRKLQGSTRWTACEAQHFNLDLQ
jgi:hypothetical protein